MIEKSEIGNATLYCGDCFDILPTLPDDSVDAVMTDPPYFRVKSEHWDRSWDNATLFIEWLGTVVAEFARVLKPNGSLYIFASSRMAARLEVEVSKRLNVLNHIVWRKGDKGERDFTRGHQANKETLRSYFPTTERIIFAEHYGADNIAKGEAGYAKKCDELRGFVFEPIRSYLATEWKLAGLSYAQANEACGVRSVAGGHYFTQSQWALPTEEHYSSLQRYANRKGGDYLRREYEDLRREYEDLRREYEDLRREYEDLRRPFTVTKHSQWGEIWEFMPVLSYAAKHPCEKPQAMLRHMLEASTKPGAVVLDAFMGTGSMGIACEASGRRFIGIEREAEYFEIAKSRIESAQRQMKLEI